MLTFIVRCETRTIRTKHKKKQKTDTARTTSSPCKEPPFAKLLGKALGTFCLASRSRRPAGLFDFLASHARAGAGEHGWLCRSREVLNVVKEMEAS